MAEDGVGQARHVVQVQHSVDPSHFNENAAGRGICEHGFQQPNDIPKHTHYVCLLRDTFFWFPTVLWQVIYDRSASSNVLSRFRVHGLHVVRLIYI